MTSSSTPPSTSTKYVMIQYDLKILRASSPWLTGHLLEIERCNVADWQAMTPP